MTPRLVELVKRYDLAVTLRPVLPLAVRDREFFKKINPLFIQYLLRDVMRLGQMQGVPVGMPDPDPIVQDMTTGVVAEEQPLIYRLTWLGIEAARQGRGLAFIAEVAPMIWGATVKGWDKGDHLANAAARAGLNLAAMEAAIAADEAAYADEVAANQQALETAGHWGVPTMVFEGEPFFGQDRLDVLLWRMKQQGLKERSGP